jgi:olfactory receptor
MKVTLFTLFLLVYFANIVASLGMIILIRLDSQIHTPMYFFLSNLSFCDLCYCTAVRPKIPVDLLSEKKPIPFFLAVLCSF